MPDITMCSGKGCPWKDKCYRATATPSEYRQSYFMVAPFVEGQDCNHYWPIEPVEQPKKTERKPK